MGDFLKADIVSQVAAATALSAAVATLGSSAVECAAGASGSEAAATTESAAADAGHSESTSAAGGLTASRSDAGEPPMSLASIGKDSLALRRVFKDGQDLHTAAESVHGPTRTTGKQEAAAMRPIVLKKALDWHGWVKDVDEILQLADNTMRSVGTLIQSGIRVSGALFPTSSASPRRAPAEDEDAGGSIFADTSNECETSEAAGANEENLMESDGGLEEESPVGAPSCGTCSASGCSMSSPAIGKLPQVASPLDWPKPTYCGNWPVACPLGVYFRTVQFLLFVCLPVLSVPRHSSRSLVIRRSIDQCPRSYSITMGPGSPSWAPPVSPSDALRQKFSLPRHDSDITRFIAWLRSVSIHT